MTQERKMIKQGKRKILLEEIQKGRRIFDSQVFAIPYAGDKYVELVTALIKKLKL